jgi:hypothetical protein
MRVLRIGLIFCGGILMTFIGGGIWGCASLKKPLLFYECPHVNESELQSWEYGMKAFKDGDYQKALKLFETLSKEVKNETLRRRSLYVLACIRLIQAKDADQFKNAMISWDVWSRLVPMERDDEDPRMLAPLLQGIASLHMRAAGKGKALRPGNDKACKELLRVKEKKIEDLLKTLDIRRHQIEDLRHKIEALETIHREIQEKKKEVSSP